MMETLYVYLHGVRVGSLLSDKGRLKFIYEDDYLNQPGATALSYTLPTEEKEHRGGNVISFFSNLLPDEGVRTRAAHYLGISPGNIFALLKHIGEDCAGAVALVPPEREPIGTPTEEYRALTEDEAHEVLRNLPVRPLCVGAAGVHISGAGAQDKLVACLRGSTLALPLNGTPSTHIIKPGMERFPESVFNEFYCMKLAQTCGIHTADCDILRIKGIPYYITTRYDRTRVAGKWKRLHQEDFCQLLGFEPTVKYESEGGPRLLQCFQLLRDLELPASDVIEFLRRILFIFLIGNGDAHAKNFSILYQEEGARLAPAYDLLSTTVYRNLPPRLAMKIEGRNNFNWISRAKFLRMGSKAGLTERLVNTEIDKLIRQLDKKLHTVTSKHQKTEPSPVYESLESGIQQRMQQLKNH